MANKLEQLRQKLLDKETKQQSFTSDNAIYAFWNIPFSSGMDSHPALVRYLPDGNEENDFFWVEMQKIRLKFPGIKGQNTDREIEVQVPCMEMYDGENSGTCPVLNEIRPWFKDSDREDLARSYWKKRSYIFQGFVRENPLSETDAPENPIRRLILNPGIFKIVKAGIFDPDMDEMPTDFTAGTDFRIIKTKQGQYANYDTSGYARRSSALTDEELAAIDQYGLKNLSDYLPKKPDAEAVRVIQEMFEASLEGDEYDPERWANFYKPYGLKFEQSNSDTVSKVTKATTASTKEAVEEEVVEEEVVEEDMVVEAVDEAPVETVAVETAPVEKKKPKDILAEIKARAEASKA